MKPAAQKLIVLTGVTKGLGEAMAAGFAQAGHQVIGCGRSPKPGQPAADAESPIHFSTVNVAVDAEVAAWAEAALKTHGAPDLLINNAALINRSAPLWEIKDEEFAALMAVNVNGVANVIRHFLPAMLRRRRGVIVNFSSGWGRSTSPEVAPYCASKWAIEGLTRALAQELPAGLAAVALNPGIINTAMLQSCFGKGAEAYPKARDWARKAVPFILQLSAKDNGAALDVPGIPQE